MAGTMHLQTTGFIASARSRSREPYSRTQKLIWIHTWLTGYSEGLADAKRAMDRGDVPILLKLARQDSPEHEVWRDIQSRGLHLLSVSNRFARKDWVQEDLIRATEKAFLQSQEGLVGLAQNRPLSPTPQVAHPSTTTELTDDERREYLRATYSRTGDDGVR